MQERTTEYGIKFRTRSEFGSLETIDTLSYADAATLYQRFTNVFLSVMVLGTDWTELLSVLIIYFFLFKLSVYGSMAWYSVHLTYRRS